MASSGGARHAYYLTEPQLLYVTKLGYIAQPIATIAQGLSKISVAFLLIRILGSVISTFRKRSLWLIIIITAVNSVIQAFLTFYQCQNPEALWNPVLAKTTYCWNPSVQANFAIYTSSQSTQDMVGRKISADSDETGWNVAMDFILALFPVSIVYSLQIATSKKIAICILLGLGLLYVSPDSLYCQRGANKLLPIAPESVQQLRRQNYTLSRPEQIHYGPSMIYMHGLRMCLFRFGLSKYRLFAD